MKYNGFKNTYGTWGKKNYYYFRTRYINEVDKKFQEKQKNKNKIDPHAPSQTIQDISAVVAFILMIVIVVWLL